MLNTTRREGPTDEVLRRLYSHDVGRNPLSLGCGGCPLSSVCGGLYIRAAAMDCDEFCCGNSVSCTVVCPRNANRFVDQVREINGFTLSNVERAPQIFGNIEHDILPLIYHGSRRYKPAHGPIFALRLSDIIDFRRSDLKYKDKEELCAAFRINPECQIIVTGVNHDRLIEPWWTLARGREKIIVKLSKLGLSAVTTPNYSLVMDVPRSDNLHSMKRIALTFAELQIGGILAGLHVNGRTERDFERWAEFVAERDEVSLLSYEFITGSGAVANLKTHLEGLSQIAGRARRPLDIVVRGNPTVIPFLRMHYRRVIYIDTTSFIKTMKRQKLRPQTNRGGFWDRAPSNPGEYLDDLLFSNTIWQQSVLKAAFYGPLPGIREAA